MSLFKRLTRIAKANVEDFLNQFDADEDPFEEKVNELESTFRDAKAAAANYSISVRNLEEERDQVVKDLETLDADAVRALEQGNEDLARDRMSEKLALEDRLYKLTPAIDESRNTYNELKANLKDIQLKLDQAKAKQVELEARRQAAEARRTAEEVLDSVQDRHEALGRAEDDVVEREIELEAERQVKDLGEGNYEQFEKKARELQIDARLEELRKRMGPED